MEVEDLLELANSYLRFVVSNLTCLILHGNHNRARRHNNDLQGPNNNNRHLLVNRLKRSVTYYFNLFHNSFPQNLHIQSETDILSFVDENALLIPENRQFPRTYIVPSHYQYLFLPLREVISPNGDITVVEDGENNMVGRICPPLVLRSIYNLSVTIGQTDIIQYCIEMGVDPSQSPFGSILFDAVSPWLSLASASRRPHRIELWDNRDHLSNQGYGASAFEEVQRQLWINVNNMFEDGLKIRIIQRQRQRHSLISRNTQTGDRFLEQAEIPINGRQMDAFILQNVLSNIHLLIDRCDIDINGFFPSDLYKSNGAEYHLVGDGNYSYRLFRFWKESLSHLMHDGKPILRYLFNYPSRHSNSTSLSGVMNVASSVLVEFPHHELLAHLFLLFGLHDHDDTTFLLLEHNQSIESHMFDDDRSRSGVKRGRDQSREAEPLYLNETEDIPTYHEFLHHQHNMMFMMNDFDGLDEGLEMMHHHGEMLLQRRMEMARLRLDQLRRQSNEQSDSEYNKTFKAKAESVNSKIGFFAKSRFQDIVQAILDSERLSDNTSSIKAPSTYRILLKLLQNEAESIYKERAIQQLRLDLPLIENCKNYEDNQLHQEITTLRADKSKFLFLLKILLVLIINDSDCSCTKFSVVDDNLRNSDDVVLCQKNKTVPSFFEQLTSVEQRFVCSEEFLHLTSNITEILDDEAQQQGLFNFLAASLPGFAQLCKGETSSRCISFKLSSLFASPQDLFGIQDDYVLVTLLSHMVSDLNSNDQKVTTRKILNNCRNRDGCTLLINAAKRGWRPVISALLIKYQGLIDLNTVDNQGESALLHCCRYGYNFRDIIMDMINAGANVESHSFEFPAHRIFSPEYTPMANNESIEVENDFTMQRNPEPILYRLCSGDARNYIVIIYILKRVEDSCGQNQLKEFLNRCHPFTHQTPLMIAAQNGFDKIVKYLLEKGADPHLTDLNGNRAVDVAKNDGIRALLL